MLHGQDRSLNRPVLQQAVAAQNRWPWGIVLPEVLISTVSESTASQSPDAAEFQWEKYSANYVEELPVIVGLGPFDFDE
jgi:hypothetical protein